MGVCSCVNFNSRNQKAKTKTQKYHLQNCPQSRNRVSDTGFHYNASVLSFGFNKLMMKCTVLWTIPFNSCAVNIIRTADPVLLEYYFWYDNVLTGTISVFFYFRDIITLTFKYNALVIYWKYVCTLKKQMFISFLCVLEQLMKLYCRNSNFETYIKIQNSKRPEDNIRLDILFPLVHTDLVSGDSSPAGSAVRAVHQIFRGFRSIFSQILANQVQERIHKRRKQRRLE